MSLWPDPTGNRAVTRTQDICAVIDRGLTAISKTCLFLTSCAMAVLIVIFGWLVFGRYVLNVTPTWVEQLSLLLVCYIAFLGTAIGVREDNHLGVTFIREALPAVLRRPLRILVDISIALFGLVMLLSCLELLEFGWSTKLPMLNIPESVRTLPAVLCGAMMLLFGASRALARVMRYYIMPDTGKTESV